MSHLSYANIQRPILTYRGDGVARAGVTKAHHSIIYTTHHAPTPAEGELPRRQPAGLLPEPPMLPHPIRVRPRYPDALGYALDRMARLNYRAVFSFDLGVKVKLFGNVHERSEENLQYQFNYIWQNTRMFTSGHYTAEGTVTSNTPATQARGAASSRSGNPMAEPSTGTGAQPPSVGRTGSGLNFEGPIDVQEISRTLQGLQDRATDQDLPAPNPVSAADQQRLALDYETRRVYFDRIRNQWRTILQQRARIGGHIAEESSSDDSNSDAESGAS